MQPPIYAGQTAENLSDVDQEIWRLRTRELASISTIANTLNLDYNAVRKRLNHIRTHHPHPDRDNHRTEIGHRLDELVDHFANLARTALTNNDITEARQALIEVRRTLQLQIDLFGLAGHEAPDADPEELADLMNAFAAGVAAGYDQQTARR